MSRLDERIDLFRWPLDRRCPDGSEREYDQMGEPLPMCRKVGYERFNTPFFSIGDAREPMGDIITEMYELLEILGRGKPVTKMPTASRPVKVSKAARQMFGSAGKLSAAREKVARQRMDKALRTDIQRAKAQRAALKKTGTTLPVK